MGFMYIKLATIFLNIYKKEYIEFKDNTKVTHSAFHVWKSGASSFNPKIYYKKNPTAKGELENA